MHCFMLYIYIEREIYEVFRELGGTGGDRGPGGTGGDRGPGAGGLMERAT